MPFTASALPPTCLRSSNFGHDPLRSSCRSRTSLDVALNVHRVDSRYPFSIPSSDRFASALVVSLHRPSVSFSASSPSRHAFVQSRDAARPGISISAPNFCACTKARPCVGPIRNQCRAATVANFPGTPASRHISLKQLFHDNAQVADAFATGAESWTHHPRFSPLR